MVSAHAAFEAGARQNKSKVTRRRIQAHSSNGGTGNPRDEGTTLEPSNVVGADRNCNEFLYPDECGGEACRDSLSATRPGGAGSGEGIPGSGGIADAIVDPYQSGRWNDRLHAGCDGPHYRSVLRRGRGNSANAAD